MQRLLTNTLPDPRARLHHRRCCRLHPSRRHVRGTRRGLQLRPSACSQTASARAATARCSRRSRFPAALPFAISAGSICGASCARSSAAAEQSPSIAPSTRATSARSCASCMERELRAGIRSGSSAEDEPSMPCSPPRSSSRARPVEVSLRTRRSRHRKVGAALSLRINHLHGVSDTRGTRRCGWTDRGGPDRMVFTPARASASA